MKKCEEGNNCNLFVLCCLHVEIILNKAMLSKNVLSLAEINDYVESDVSYHQ